MDYKRYELAIKFRIVYPNAGAFLLNKGLWYIGTQGADGNENKMSGGIALSGQFSKEADAWDDAYYQFAERQEDIEANLALYQCWREAGSPRDLTKFVEDMGIHPEDESTKPVLIVTRRKE